MRQRILDGFDDGFVQFGILSLHLDADLLAKLGRQVTHDTRELRPYIADPAASASFITHSCSSVVIRFSRWAVFVKLASSNRLVCRTILVSRKHQFTHARHEFVQQAHIYHELCCRWRRQPPSPALRPSRQPARRDRRSHVAFDREAWEELGGGKATAAVGRDTGGFALTGATLGVASCGP